MKLNKKFSYIIVSIITILTIYFPSLPVRAAFSEPIDSAALYVSAASDFPASVSTSNCFTTVIDAVNYNEANGGGKTIYVDDGTYTGSFYINMPVKIIGTSQDAIIQCTESVPQPGQNPNLGAPTCVWVMSSDVTIQNLTIKGCLPTRPYGVQCCVYVTASNIQNVNIVSNNLQPDYYADASADAGYGIVTQSMTTAHITNLNISGNTIQPVNSTTGATRPFVINPGCENVTIENNDIKGKYVTGSIFSGQDHNVKVNNNTFEAISSYSVCVWEGGVPEWGNVAVTNNRFLNYTSYPVYIYHTGMPTVTGNTFTDILNKTAPSNVAIKQYTGTSANKLSNTATAGDVLNNTPYVYAIPEYQVSGSYYIDYIPQTYTVEYYKDAITPANKIGTSVSGNTFLSSTPITASVVNADLGSGWIDAQKPTGYGSGVATYPAASTVVNDNVVKVLYTPIPSTTFTVSQVGGTSGTADTTGIRLDFAQPVSLMAADVSITHATVNNVTTLDSNGASWLVSFTPSEALANGSAVSVTVSSGDRFTITGNSTQNVVVYRALTSATPAITPLATPESLTSVDNATDVSPSDWHYAPVKFVIEKGLFKGTSGNTFSPDTNMTRAMMITVLARYEGVDTTVGATWYSAALDWAISKGITDGTDIDSDITREQLITLLWRYAGSPASTHTLAFSDDSTISPYALDAMRWAVGKGIITGYPDNTILPQGYATRAEGAAIIQRFESSK